MSTLEGLPSERMKALVDDLINAAGRDGYEEAKESGGNPVGFDEQEFELLNAIAELELVVASQVARRIEVEVTRTAVADLLSVLGCSCCATEQSMEFEQQLAELLAVPKRPESGVVGFQAYAWDLYETPDAEAIP